jgi:undecaprenyl-diphosphatase
MGNIIGIIRDVIQHYGYFGIFSIVSLEQFILPLPVPPDVFVVIGSKVGLITRNILFYVALATLIGSYMGYFLGKYLGHPVIKWIFGKEKLDKAEGFIKKYGVWGVIVAGLTPLFPFKIVTWSCGIFEMPFLRYTIGILLGRVPRYLLTSYAVLLVTKTKFYTSVNISAVILGALQGLTEFLPISSSGHLAIMEHFVKLPPNITAGNLEIFDIFLHGGSLLALIIYFWKDWIKVIKELWFMITRRIFKKDTLTAKLIIGTIPAVFAALIFKDLFENQMRSIFYLVAGFILNAIIYLYAEWRSKNNTRDTVTLKQSFYVGLAQALALIPSVSRSGFTLVTGMIMGLKREAAARFSFMLGGVALVAANIYALLSLIHHPVMPGLSFTLIGTTTSFIASLLTISWLLKFLEKHTLRPFAFYLLVLSAVMMLLFR